MVLLLCAGLALTLDTQVRLPGLSRLLPPSTIGFGRPSGPATVAVPADQKARQLVNERPMTDTDDRQVRASDSEKRSAGIRKAPTNPPRRTAAKPSPRATAPASTPPAAESTPPDTRQPPGRVKRTTPPSAQPTNPGNSNANDNGQGNGLAKGKAKGKKDAAPPVRGADPTMP